MSKKHTYVLGLNTYDNDVSACLLKDGAIAFAIAAFVPKGIVLPINPVRLAGALVAFGMLLYFFRRSRPTIIAAIAIPSSIIATFAAMRYENFTLNVITLLALTLAVGIVIDDAVVVLENIFRFMEEKKMPPAEAAVGDEPG